MNENFSEYTFDDIEIGLSKEFQVALLLVTHDQASTRICNRVISMKDGTLV